MLRHEEEYEGDDQTVQSHAFGQTDEDQGLTEHGVVLGDGAQSGGGGRGNGQTAAGVSAVAGQVDAVVHGDLCTGG